MNSPDVAAALHAGAPDAAGQLYDAHAEALLQFCWLTLRSRQRAHTAVCDALVQAGARVAELRDPGTLRAWLFTLARAECHRHPLPSLGDTDEPIARPQQRDAALRIMAWNSVMSLDLLERQALDLSTRHGMTAAEIGLILGLPLPGATELLASAKQTLERALGAEILVSRDSLECPGRTEAIDGWTGTVTSAFRDRLLEHAGTCAVCRPRLPRNVSPGRIFGLLPAPAMDPGARSHVIARVSELARREPAEPEAELAGPDAAHNHRPVEIATPELALLPAPVTSQQSPQPQASQQPLRSPTSTRSPKPSASARSAKPAAAQARPSGQQKRRRRGLRLFAGLGAAVVALAVAAGLAYGSLGSNRAQLSGANTRLGSGKEAPAQAGAGGPVPQPDTPPVTPRTHGKAKKSTLTSPAAGVGGADAVTSGKQTGSGPHGTTRIVTQGHGSHRTVTVTVVPSSKPAKSGGSGTGPRPSATPTPTAGPTPSSASGRPSPSGKPKPSGKPSPSGKPRPSGKPSPSGKPKPSKPSKPKPSKPSKPKPSKPSGSPTKRHHRKPSGGASDPAGS